MAYDRIEPIGDRRLDLLVAHLSSVVYSMGCLAAHIEPKLPPESFMPKWRIADDEDDEKDAAELLRTKANQAFGSGGMSSGSRR
jgi:hypothetical protein